MKKTNNLHIILFIVLFVSTCFFKSIGHSLEPDARGKMNQSSKTAVRSVAILPLVNMSGSDAEAPDIIAMIKEKLANNNIKAVSREKTEEFLVKERIRDIGLLSRAEIRKIGKFLKVDGIILPCVNLLNPEETLMIGIGCRMVSGHNGSLVWFNHVSLAGSDFTSWLGLMTVTSMEELAEAAVERLLSTFPEEVIIKFNTTDLSEITEFSANPQYVHSSGRIDVRVKFTVVGKKIKDVKAILGAQESPLTSEQEFVYSGSVNAPGKEGKYLLKIETRDDEDNVSLFNSLAIIRVDDTPPNVTIYSQEELFSPNRDKRNDMIIISPFLNESESVASWEFIVENSENHMTRKAGGENVLPSSLIWRGEDNFYSPAADGKYFYSLRVTDRAGNETTTEKRMVILDKTRPRIKMEVEERGENSWQFLLDCEEENGIDKWQLSIVDSDYKTLKLFEGAGDVPPSLQWDTAPPVNAKLTYSLKVTDLAGNRLVIRSKPLKVKPLQEEETSSNENDESEKWDSEF